MKLHLTEKEVENLVDELIDEKLVDSHKGDKYFEGILARDGKFYKVEYTISDGWVYAYDQDCPEVKKESIPNDKKWVAVPNGKTLKVTPDLIEEKLKEPTTIKNLVESVKDLDTYDLCFNEDDLRFFVSYVDSEWEIMVFDDAVEVELKEDNTNTEQWVLVD